MVRLLLLSMLPALALAVNGSVMREYNHVDFIEYSSHDQLLSDVFTMPGGGASTNFLLGIASEACMHMLDSPALKGAQRHAAGDVLRVGTILSDIFPLEIGGCAEIIFYRFNDTLTEPSNSLKEDKIDHISLTAWEADLMRTTVTFSNRFDFPIMIKWHDESKESVNHGMLQPGESSIVHSFIGHIFSAHNMSGGAAGPIVDYMVIDGSSYVFNAANRLEMCEVVPGKSFGTFVQGELSCDDMYLRFTEFSNNMFWKKRLALNFVQPQMVRAVTESGFENRQLPAETYRWLKAWYDEQQRVLEEEEGPAGPCMNQHVAPSSITHLTAELKDRLSRELQSTLEDWYGHGELTMTSIYGVRKYINGSVLRMHVDTVNTHVVSAIINVDQQSDRDWPLLILDHDDNEHVVVMKPGDMLLYESAKLLHGRPEPFVGSHYDNIFIHYKPVSGWDYGWV